MAIFVPGDLDLWPLTLTFKLVRASLNVRFHTFFLRIWHKSVQGFPRYYLYKQKSRRQRQKQNLTQLTACG